MPQHGEMTGVREAVSEMGETQKRRNLLVEVRVEPQRRKKSVASGPLRGIADSRELKDSVRLEGKKTPTKLFLRVVDFSLSR